MDTKTMIREVKNVAEKHKNDRKFTGQTVITDMCNDIIPKLEKLEEYETAKEEGRLLVLPCKVGTPLYKIIYQRDNFDDQPYPIVTIVKFKYEMIDQIGKTVFLSREEAEKALKEMEEYRKD